MVNNIKEQTINEIRLIKKNTRKLIKYLNIKNSKLQQRKLKKELIEIEKLIRKISKS
jgi:hypothetical protein